jgi:fibronectin-binding autotransporter adhesin
MKIDWAGPSRCLRRIVWCGLMSLAGEVHAANFYWDGGSSDIAGNGNAASDGGGGTWNNTITNWDAGAVPHTNWPNLVNAHVAHFGGPGGTVLLGADMGATGTYPNAINVTNGNYVFNLNGFDLSFRGVGLTVSSGATLILTNGTVTLQSSGFNVNGANALDIYAKITGAADLTKSGAGDLYLRNDANDFTGKLAVQNGFSVFVSSISDSGVASAAGAGSVLEIGQSAALTYNGAAGTSSDRAIGLTNLSVAGVNHTIFNNGGGALVLRGAINNARGFVNGSLVLGGLNTGANELQGDLSNSASFTLGVIKQDAGTWILSGANTCTGTNLINAGLLAITNGAAIADTAAVNLLNVAGARLRVDSSETIGGLRGGGANGGSIELNGSGVTLTVADNANGTFSGAIGGAGRLTKTGAGTLSIAGSNTYSGELTVEAGSVAMTSANILIDTMPIRVNGGTFAIGTQFDVIGSLIMSNGLITVGSGGGLILSTNLGLTTGELTLLNGGVNITGGSGTKFDVIGPITLGHVTLTNSSSAATPFDGLGRSTGLTVLPGSTAVFTNVGGGAVRFNTYNAPRTFDVGTNASLYMGWTVASSGAGGALIKTGAGVMTLAASNGYAGTTAVNEGLLVMNGVHAGGSAWTVAGSGTLGGSGSIFSTVTVHGAISPGTGIGVLAVNSNVLWNAGVAWPFELGAAPSCDRLAISGSFTKGSGSGFSFDLQGTGVAGVYTLVTWSASTTFVSGDFSVVNVPGGLTPSFSVNVNDLTLTLTGGGAPILGVSPASLDFGGVQAGSSSSLVFVVTNSGAALLTGTAAVGGLPYAVSGGASYSVAAGGSSNVTIGFTPTLAQTYPDSVTFQSNGGGSTNVLTGYGFIIAGSTNAAMSLADGRVAFGFNLVSGALYRVQASTNLLDPVENGFSDITGQLTNRGAATIVYTNVSSERTRAFRVKSP